MHRLHPHIGPGHTGDVAFDDRDEHATGRADLLKAQTRPRKIIRGDERLDPGHGFLRARFEQPEGDCGGELDILVLVAEHPREGRSNLRRVHSYSPQGKRDFKPDTGVRIGGSG